MRNRLQGQSLKKVYSWLSTNGLFYLSLLLLIFIPLYPKIPLAEIIPGYLVRVRLEDILVLTTGLWWLVKVIRKKHPWKSSFLSLIVLYAAAGLLSILSGIFLLQSVPLEFVHLSKTLLHYFRYLEYFSLFVLFFSSLKDKSQFKKIIIVLTTVVALISLYGFGQKYWHWPLFSTMNREFSKGQVLYLTEHARVQSTFAGHYDLAAYLVIVLPLLFSIALKLSKRWSQIVLGLISLAGLWLLTASASKIALVAYGLSMTVVVFLNLNLKNWWQKLILWLGGGVVSLILLLVVLFFASPGTLRSLVDSTRELPFLSQQLKIQELLTRIEFALPAKPAPTPNANGFTQTGPKPSDVYVDVPDYVKVATVSASGEKGFILEERERTWSENALKYGLSMGIRLDTLWPQAIKGFIGQPYLGKGYATLNKTTANQFLEADSTDNNYLRVLGEIGLVGFIIFYGLIFSLVKTAWQLQQKTNDKLVASFSIGFIAATLGILVNALIIDVFAASKVAFNYWALAGILAKLSWLDQPSWFQNREKEWWSKLLNFARQRGLFLIILGLFLGLSYKQPLAKTGPILAFEHSQQAVEPVLQAKCWLGQLETQTCQLSLNWLDKSYALFLTPFYSLINHLSSYYLANLCLGILSLILLYRLLSQIFDKNITHLLLLSYVLLPWIYLLPAKTSPWNLICPIGLLLLNWLSSKLKVKFKTEVTIGPLMIAILIGLFLPHSWQVIHNNFNAQPPAWAYQTLERANQIFSQPKEAHQSIQLISTLNPNFKKLIGNQNYQLIELARTNFPHYQDLLQNEESLYLNNLGVEKDFASFKTYLALKSEFGLKLTEIDCNHQCNFYQVLTTQPALETQPISLNDQQLSPQAQGGELSFIIYNQRYLDDYQPAQTNPNQPDLSQTLTGRLDTFKKIAAQEPDFLIIGGDVVNKQEESYQRYFERNFADKVSFPITFLAGNYDQTVKKIYPSSTQTFAVGQNLFILYQPTADEGRVTAQMEKDIFNAFLWLEKQPQIENIFVISQRPNWLAQGGHYQAMSNQIYTQLGDFDHFFEDTLLPKLKSLSQEVFIVSGDLRPTELGPSLFYELYTTQPKYHYLALNAFGRPEDPFVKFEIDANGEVIIKAYTNQGELLPSLFDFSPWAQWQSLMTQAENPQPFWLNLFQN